MTFANRSWLRSGAWAILGVVLLAFGLRLVNLNARPFWYDEAFSILYAEKPLAKMLYGTIIQTNGAAAEEHPLLYYVLLHGWMRLFGESPAAVRALSVALGVATVAVVYALGRYLFDRRAGLLAALVTAVAPFALYYAQETRMYALLGLAAMTATYCFVRAWVEHKPWQWAAFAVAGAVTLYAHNLGALFVVSLDTWVLWAWWRQRRFVNLRSLFLAHVLMALLFAPWLAILPSQLNKVRQAYWVAQPGLVSLLQTTMIFHFAYDNEALPGWLLPLAIAFSLLIPVILVLEWRRASRLGTVAAGAFPMPVALLVCLTLLPPLLAFGVSQVRPVYVVRGFLPSALAYYVLAAGLLTRQSTPRLIRWGVLGSAGLIALASLLNHYTYAEFPRSPFGETAVFLAQHTDPATDIIVHSNKMTYFPTYTYDRALPMAFIADEPSSPADTLAYATQEALEVFASPDLITAVNGRQRVWFVIFDTALAEYAAVGRRPPQLDWLNAHYKQTNLVQFNDLRVYLFEK